MSQKNPAALDFLLTRRSRPAKTLTTPVPTRDELGPILQAAARAPDHGKLEPWELVVLEGGAPSRLAGIVELRERPGLPRRDRRSRGGRAAGPVPQVRQRRRHRHRDRGRERDRLELPDPVPDAVTDSAPRPSGV